MFQLKFVVGSGSFVAVTIEQTFLEARENFSLPNWIRMKGFDKPKASIVLVSKRRIYKWGIVNSVRMSDSP